MRMYFKRNVHITETSQLWKCLMDDLLISTKLGSTETESTLYTYLKNARFSTNDSDLVNVYVVHDIMKISYMIYNGYTLLPIHAHA